MEIQHTQAKKLVDSPQRRAKMAPTSPPTPRTPLALTLTLKVDLQVYRSTGDGNCLFTALAKGLERAGVCTSVDASSLRGLLAEFVKEQREFFEGFVADGYASCQSDPPPVPDAENRKETHAPRIPAPPVTCTTASSVATVAQTPETHAPLDSMFPEATPPSEQTVSPSQMLSGPPNPTDLGWACTKCTFHNGESTLCCVLCLATRTLACPPLSGRLATVHAPLSSQRSALRCLAAVATVLQKVGAEGKLKQFANDEATPAVTFVGGGRYHMPVPPLDLCNSVYPPQFTPSPHQDTD